MKKIYIFILCLVFVSTSFSRDKVIVYSKIENNNENLKEDYFAPLQNLVSRQFPELQGKVSFEFIKTISQETATCSVSNNHIHIKSTSKSAALYALHNYLKKYCHSSFSFFGNHIKIPKHLPNTAEEVVISAVFPLRYALNYCTINYTMSFYQWQEWEQLLDQMALNGVNLLLTPVGTEAVWVSTLKRLGYKEEEVLDFIPGPAFSAWWLMGNLEGWGGKVTSSMIDRQTKLQQKILARMKELGIQPVLQGFYGMVPSNLDNKKGYKIIPQGNWAGGFLRPALLYPDENFNKIADIYYEELKKLYGEDFLYFAGDPFHEGGNSKDVKIAEYAHLIQQKMKEHFPESTWVLQGWGHNPSSELLSKLDKEKILVQELFGENTDHWLQRKGYENSPFLWCSVTNFGDKNGLNGKLQHFADEIHKIRTSPYISLAKGVGIMPEGLGNNPVVYDLILSLAWEKEKVSVNQWIVDFVFARYGENHPELIQAWDVFLQTIYSSPHQRQEGAPESVFCMRPSLENKSVSTWGSRDRLYDTERFKKGVELFVLVDDKMKNCSTYQIDKIDFLRQVLANKGEAVYEKMLKAFQNKDKKSFEKESDLFLSYIELQDDLLSYNSYFQLYSWLKQADDFSKTPYEKALSLKNAKTQISYWGADNPTTNLQDYAHKEWNGMLRFFYLPRWKMFITHCKQVLDGKNSPVPNYFSFEKAWTELPDMYVAQQLSAKKQKDIIKKILK